MSDYVSVSVSVPEQRLPEFYEMFGRWLSTNGSVNAQAGWINGDPWTDDDGTAALALYRTISPAARAIVDFWVSQHGQWTTGDETAAAVGVNGPRGVAGSLSSIGKAASRMKRALPFEYEPGEPGTSGRYQIKPAVAALFEAARREFGR